MSTMLKKAPEPYPGPLTSAKKAATPQIQNIWEAQATMFMNGLRNRMDSLQKDLEPDQELVVTHGANDGEIRVTSLRMPSANTVVLCGEDSGGCRAEVFMHISAVNLCFRIRRILPPEKAKRLGF